jgi:hypothetical protein
MRKRGEAGGSNTSSFVVVARCERRSGSDLRTLAATVCESVTVVLPYYTDHTVHDSV